MDKGPTKRLRASRSAWLLLCAAGPTAQNHSMHNCLIASLTISCRDAHEKRLGRCCGWRKAVQRSTPCDGLHCLSHRHSTAALLAIVCITSTPYVATRRVSVPGSKYMHCHGKQPLAIVHPYPQAMDFRMMSAT